MDFTARWILLFHFIFHSFSLSDFHIYCTLVCCYISLPPISLLIPFNSAFPLSLMLSFSLIFSSICPCWTERPLLTGRVYGTQLVLFEPWVIFFFFFFFFFFFKFFFPPPIWHHYGSTDCKNYVGVFIFFLEPWTRMLRILSAQNSDDPNRDQHIRPQTLLHFFSPSSFSYNVPPSTAPHLGFPPFKKKKKEKKKKRKGKKKNKEEKKEKKHTLPFPGFLLFADTCILFRKILFLAYTEMIRYKI
ncbi:hypothetical protein AOLI_G00226760 [Acnodon oligacanthus]